MKGGKMDEVRIESRLATLEAEVKAIPTLVNAQFASLNIVLDEIKMMQKQANGRTSKLENEVELMEEEFRKEIAWGHHIVDTRSTECPQIKSIEKITSKLEKMDENLGEYKFFKKYPKAAVYIIAVTLFLFVGTALGVISSYKRSSQNKEIIEKIDKLEKEVMK